MALADELLARIDETRRARMVAAVGGAPALAALIEGQLGAAEQAWPGLRLPRADFAAYLAARLPDEGDDLGPLLASLRVGDLYLACGCARGDARALAALDAGYLTDVAAAVSRMQLPGTAVDDVLQTLRHQLLVSDGSAPPRIAEYAGRGDLRAWLRVTAVRAALKAIRPTGREVAAEDDQLASLPAAGGAADAELDYVKRQYRSGFKRAFLDSLATLPDRDQNLLRQHYLDDLSIDQLGALYRVNRSTAARWITKAQSTLLERTKRTLVKQMKVSRSECDDIIRLAQSQLHITLRRLTAK